MKANSWICLLSAVVFCLSVSSCKKKPNDVDQPASSSAIQQEKPSVTTKESVAEEERNDPTSQENTKAEAEEPSKPLDLSLDKVTVDSMRDGSSDIVEEQEQLSDLFEKEENRVKLNSRVVIDEETEDLSEAAGAELNLELKVK